MNKDRLTEILREFQPSAAHGADPQLRALEVAIFLEDVFGITLTDEQIDTAVPGDVESMSAIVAACRESD